MVIINFIIGDKVVWWWDLKNGKYHFVHLKLHKPAVECHKWNN